MEAWPIDRTKRSRLGQAGSCGSKLRNCCHRQYATGAMAIGVPGWPELAACTPSIASVRIVLMLVGSMGERTDASAETIAVLIGNPFANYLLRPAPPGDFRSVDPMFIRVSPATDLPVAEFFLRVRANGLKF